MPNRFLLVLALAFAACTPNTAEVRCGTSACGANQRCEPKNLICVLDEAPELIITEPRLGALVAGDTLVVGGTVRDDNGPSTLELSLDGNTWFAVPLSGTKFSAKVALPTLDHQPMKLQLRAHDTRQQAVKADVTVQVDNVAPQLTLGYPLDGAALGAAWFVVAGQVTGEARDGSGLASLTVDVGTGAQPVGATGEAFEWKWAPPEGEDGVAHAIVVTAIDLAGNRTEVVRAVTVDVVAPKVSFAVPAEDALLGPAFVSGGGVVGGAVSAGAKVSIDVGAGPVPALMVDGAWSFVYRPLALDFVPQVLTVEAVDVAGNSARAERVVIVDLVAPKLGFTGTLNGARLNIASFPQGNDVSASWAVSDGDAQVEVTAKGATAANPFPITTSPADNPKTYGLTLTALDRAGNHAQASISFEVDRVAPVVTQRAPLDGTRHWELGAAVHFSEPMTGGAGLVLSPSIGTGAWSAPNVYAVTGLTHDTVFTMNVGPATDLFGNPLAPQPATSFHTTTATPAFNTPWILDVAKFEVSVDADGVFHLFTASATTPATYRWMRTNPKTGLLEEEKPTGPATVGVAFNRFGVVASARPNPDLSTRRVAGATTFRNGTIGERKAWTRFDDQTANADLGLVGVIPFPAMAGEGTGLGEVGYLKLANGAVSYARSGKTDLATGMGEAATLGFGATRWELAEVTGTTLKVRSYQCVPGVGGFPATCGFTPITQFTDVAVPETVSIAVGERCSLYTYDAPNGARMFRGKPWPTSCGNKACPPEWSTDSYPIASELKVASDGNERFILAERQGSYIRMYRMFLDAGCNPITTTITNVAIPVGAKFQPVSFLGSPALVWLDGTTLKVAK